MKMISLLEFVTTPPTNSPSFLDLSNHFVRKINVSSLSDVWTNQWAALPPESSTSRTVAYARGCVVDGDAVYVMGVVQDDARMVQGITPQPSQGGDDVWVAMLDKATVDVSWITQLGSYIVNELWMGQIQSLTCLSCRWILQRDDRWILTFGEEPTLLLRFPMTLLATMPVMVLRATFQTPSVVHPIIPTK
jgi:hypothetical protein